MHDNNMNIIHLHDHIQNKKHSDIIISFQRPELKILMDIYGKMVSHGVWKDYAIDHGPKIAFFSIFKKSGDNAVFIVEKDPKKEKKQALYALKDQSGQILKRGNDLRLVLDPLYKKHQKIEMTKTSH